MARNAKLLTLGLLGGASTISVPLTISGLALWLDASDASTLFQAHTGTTPAVADNDVVGYWGDKSGNGKHVTQSTAAYKPVLKLNIQNGKPAILGNASKSLYNASVTLSSFAVIAVFKASTGYIVWEHSANAGANDGAGLYALAGPIISVRRSATTSAKSQASIADNTTRVTATEFQGPHADLKLRLNGANATLTNTTVNDLTASSVSDGFYVLARGATPTAGIAGHLMELCAYSPYPGLEAIQQLEAYLNAKWAVY
jgi:hypothetical protein